MYAGHGPPEPSPNPRTSVHKLPHHLQYPSLTTPRPALEPTFSRAAGASHPAQHPKTPATTPTPPDHHHPLSRPSTSAPRRKHAGPSKHAAPATSHATPQLRARPLHRLHALERSLRRLRFAVPHRRRALRIHGARVRTRRPAILVEPGCGHTGRGDCRVQCEGEGYSDCAPRGAEIWRRVSGTERMLRCDGGAEEPRRCGCSCVGNLGRRQC